MTNKITELREALRKIKPITRTPFSVMHPYPSRKPLNVIEEIIEYLSDPNDIVLDGFMGSGTSIFASIIRQRSVVGVELNKVAFNLVKTTLNDYDLNKFSELIDKLVGGIFKDIDKLWLTQCDRCGNQAEIEREYFDIVNSDKDKIGQLILCGIKYHCPTCKPGKQVYFTKVPSTDDTNFLNSINELARQRFKRYDRLLIRNSRIAIQNGSYLSDYFSSRNMLSTAMLLDEVHDIAPIPEKELVLLCISSMVHLLKLSDWKGGTQMPYWRPKKKFTGRNPKKFFLRSYKNVLAGKRYINENLDYVLIDDYNSFRNQTEESVILHQGDIISFLQSIPSKSINLILTDPPYSDQVPYLEYSTAWDALLKLNNLNPIQLENEIVISDSPSRNKDENNYASLFDRAMQEMGRVLSDNSYFAIFYHDFNLNAWSNLIQSTEKANLRFVTQFNIGRQFKSVKNVWNPKTSLDGNSIVIFKRVANSGKLEAKKTDGFWKDFYFIGKEIIAEHGGKATTQQLYDDGILDFTLSTRKIVELAEKYKTLIPLFEDYFNIEDGYWVINN